MLLEKSSKELIKRYQEIRNLEKQLEKGKCVTHSQAIFDYNGIHQSKHLCVFLLFVSDIISLY